MSLSHKQDLSFSSYTMSHHHLSLKRLNFEPKHMEEERLTLTLKYFNTLLGPKPSL
jgi:hypothetical protein